VKTCIKGGEALGVGSYNQTTRTWWFDANLNYAKQGCNPACVVSEDTATAEINWRCTGLLPQAASLTSHKWIWVASEKEGRAIEPKKPDTFSLVFGDDGNVAIGTDCNSMSASYTAKDGKISLGEMATTMMYCEGSQEQEFSGLLRGVSKYEITPSGEPMLELSSGKTFVILKGVGR
jgi:heat shock protein HslJ